MHLLQGDHKEDITVKHYTYYMKLNSTSELD